MDYEVIYNDFKVKFEKDQATALADLYIHLQNQAGKELEFENKIRENDINIKTLEDSNRELLLRATTNVLGTGKAEPEEVNPEDGINNLITEIGKGFGIDGEN